MLFSVNCLILGQDSNNIFNIPIDKTLTSANGVVIKFDELAVSNFKEILFCKKKVNDIVQDSDDMNLYKVELDLKSLKDKIYTEDEIKSLGMIMEPINDFKDYFDNEDKKPKKKHLHIFIVPTTAQGITHNTEKILEEILKDVKTEVPKDTTKKTIGLFMPLKDRNTRHALSVITDNAYRSLYPRTSKTDFNFLICGGAPGIGKTRWGIELFESLKHDWTPPFQWTKPHFLYFLLDFVNGVRLSEFDQNLSASIIIGLRIAYKYFAQDQLSFDSFKYAALATEKSLNAFNITLVLDRIRKSLNLKSDKQLIILLHIDEYQEIIDFDNNGYWKVKVNSSKGLFKEMLNETGKLMVTENRIDYYVQTFLSGTALQEVTKNFEPSSYSSEFVECPLLSTTAILEIVDYYANENGDKQQGWMTSASFLQILYDTGGLPRALQYVLEKSLSTNDFFNQLKEGKFSFFNDIFNSVVETLNQKYCIRSFVKKNEKASRQLLYHCICDIPVKLDQVLDTNNPQLTLEKLERDGYLILTAKKEKNNEQILSYFVQMPFYFIFLYNLELNIAPGILHVKFQPDPDMYWEEWERFVAQFEVFYNNLLLDIGIEEISLRDYYRGAFGKNNVLDIQIRLKRLIGVCETNNQFPKTGQPKRKSDNTTMPLESDYVFINGKSASFADAYVTRSKDIIGLQQKWHEGFDFISIHEITNECKKNNDAINNAKQKKMKFLNDFRVITIIFTSQQFNEADVSNLPNNCLVIANNNFGQYFGHVFSSRLAFSMLYNFNLNFARPDQIVSMFKGIGKATSSQICRRRPYYDADDLINKNGNYNSVKKVKVELEKCSYTPYSNLKNSYDFLKNQL